MLIQKPWTDEVLFEATQRAIRAALLGGSGAQSDLAHSPPVVPAGVTERVHSGESFAQVRAAKMLACADAVIATKKPNGRYGAMFSKRKATEPFGNLWWIYGGSIGAYMSIEEFIAARVEKECGVPIDGLAKVGVYSTSAADFPQSTLQVCYAALVPFAAAVEKMRPDANHESVNIFTHEELESIPVAEQHWYPMHVARRVLGALEP